MLSRTSAAVAAVLLAGTVHARGVSPYLPLQLSPEIERQIELVLLYADKPVLKRPIAAATVLDALPAACQRDPAVCADVRRYLSGYMRSAGLSHASVAASADSGAEVTLANRRGMTTASAYEVSAQAYWQPNDHFLLGAGFLAYEDEINPVGSLASFGFERAQIDVGFRDHWFSPLTRSAMLISTEAETMPSITLSNYTPMTRWNVSYELFLAEMSNSDRIRYGDGYTSGHPRLAGLHFSIEPVSGWSIGVNRIMQFGGGARGGNSFRDLLDAFFNPSGADNRSPDLSINEEFGNQAASITSRLLIPGSTPVAIYLEYAGEDTSTLSNIRLGNVALSGGVQFPSIWGGKELTFEASEWQNGWYEHGIYQDGLRENGHVIGHWGGDWRAVGDGVGALSLMARIAWQPRFGGWLEATYSTLQNEAYSAVEYDRAQSLDVLYSHDWRQFRVGAELNAGSDVFGQSYSRLSAFIRY